ncbi:putative transposase [Stenotrophomonas sp. 2619]|uniref:REP-associated tyrosine transposase n=1 Tax=Stenotrophomonas sp. 2619 TaxID=3156316 RepID=UPI003398181C
MASPALQRGRFSCQGHCYVVTTVTARRQRLFAVAANADEMIRWMQASDREGRTRSMAWVVMPDHVHWMFTLRSTTLATVVRTTKSRAAKAINQRNGTHGAIWQPGYYDQLQRDERQWLTEADYILSNPVRAGLATAVGEYPFAWCRWPTP